MKIQVYILSFFLSFAVYASDHQSDETIDRTTPIYVTTEIE